MTSYEMVQALTDFLAAVNSQSYVLQSLKRLSDEHRVITTAASLTIDTNGGAAQQQNEQTRGLAAKSIQTCRSIRPIELSRELLEMSRALQAFHQKLPAPEANMLKAYQGYVAAFENAYNNFFENSNYSKMVLLLAAADSLYSAIESDRGILSLVARNLQNDLSVDESDPALQRLCLLFEGPASLDGVASKILAIQSIYSELCALLKISDQQYPLVLRKLETGTTWMDLLGYPAIIRLMEKYIDGAAGFIYRNFTKEGQLGDGIPKKMEAIENAIDFTKRLQEAGINTEEMTDNLAKAAVKVSQELNRLIGGEPAVTVNGQRQAVGDAYRQRMIDQQRTHLLEHMAEDSRVSAPEVPPERPGG